VGRQYPGRPVAVADDPLLGAGLQVQAGDDIVDASVRGIIRKIIVELGST
jgi:F0F1-type ATP synthase delta subunit